LAALKQVHFVTEDDLEDYSVEISILSECHHKNVVALLESFIYDSRLWVRMSLLHLLILSSVQSVYFCVKNTVKTSDEVDGNTCRQ